MGLLVAVSLVLIMLPETASKAADVAHASAACQAEASAAAPVLDRMDCGLTGSHSGCVSHSGCLAFTLPAARGVAIALPAANWMPPGAEAGAGRTPTLFTPPPIAAA